MTITIHKNNMRILSVDIGGSSVKYGIVNSNGELSERGSLPTPETLEGLYGLIEELFHQTGAEGIALSCPGAVDCQTGYISGSSAVSYIHGPNIKADLSERLQTKVEMENDANCAALAEVWLGAAKSANDCCFVVCGSGIGGAVVKDRKIHHGAHLHGGEFGYMVINYDAKHTDIWSHHSNVAVVKKAEKELGEPLDGKKLFDGTETNAIYEKYADDFYTSMAVGMFNVQYMYDPEMIIIGGEISKRADILDQIERRMDLLLVNIPEAHIRPVIRKSQFGNQANLIGAAYHYMNAGK